jgi:Bacterial transcriptional activator domain
MPTPASAQRGGPGRSAILAEALGLWRGPPLADFTYEPFAHRVIIALSELRLVAVEDRMFDGRDSSPCGLESRLGVNGGLVS